MSDGKFTLASPVFADNGIIPTKYTCKGEGVSPPLSISDIPEKAVGLALIMHDPDAPSKDFLHWSLWNLSPTTEQIDEATVPVNSIEGLTDFGKIGYGGPCPPSGAHRYVFELYALDEEVQLPMGSSRQALLETMKDHVLATANLTGTFGED